MKLLETEFVMNANATGNQTFKQIRKGTNPAGKNVYVYERIRKDGSRFSFEVFIASVKKAGTYKLPGDKTITYPEDMEEYPGASKFGFSAWEFHQTLAAMDKFEELVKSNVEEVVESEISSEETPTVPEKPKQRGRPKVERPVIEIPMGEFSVKEIAEKNGVEYFVAATFIKEQETAGAVRRTRQERRAERGKPTQLFEKVVLR